MAGAARRGEGTPVRRACSGCPSFAGKVRARFRGRPINFSARLIEILRRWPGARGLEPLVPFLFLFRRPRFIPGGATLSARGEDEEEEIEVEEEGRKKGRAAVEEEEGPTLAGEAHELQRQRRGQRSSEVHCLGWQGAERRKVLRGEESGAAGAKGSGRKEDTGNEKTIGKNDERAGGGRGQPSERRSAAPDEQEEEREEGAEEEEEEWRRTSLAGAAGATGKPRGDATL